MKIRSAERMQAKIKLAIQGLAGSGKSFSALKIAKGLIQDYSKVVVIDTENGSADLYAEMGDYNVLTLETPHTPEKYMKAIDKCVEFGAECIIIDSISHAWDNLLQHHATMGGNSFTNWGKITPRHKAFVNKFLEAPVHIIATMRTKQDYIITQKNGKQVPEKVGLKAIQRDGLDYEFTLVFELDILHNCNCTKDRTGLFINQTPFQITEKTGQLIKQWCEQGVSIEEVRELISNCNSIETLTEVYKKYTSFYSELIEEFSAQKKRIKNKNLINLKSSQNGTTNHK